MDLVFTQIRVPGILPGCKGGRCVGLTILPHSYADCLEIWKPQPRGTLRACPGLYRDCVTLTFVVWTDCSEWRYIGDGACDRLWINIQLKLCVYQPGVFSKLNKIGQFQSNTPFFIYLPQNVFWFSLQFCLEHFCSLCYPAKIAHMISYIVICGLHGFTNFPTLSHKRHDFGGKNVIYPKMCFDFLYNFV